MPTPTEFFRFWILDERTGKRRLTTYKLTRADAERQFPGAEPDLQTPRDPQPAGPRRDAAGQQQAAAGLDARDNHIHEQRQRLAARRKRPLILDT